jgi:dipeptidase E
LGLLPFEFFPHLNADPNYLSELLRYNKISSSPIVACNDGDGVVVRNGKVEFIGAPLWIADGQINEAQHVQPRLNISI